MKNAHISFAATPPHRAEQAAAPQRWRCGRNTKHCCHTRRPGDWGARGWLKKAGRLSVLLGAFITTNNNEQSNRVESAKNQISPPVMTRSKPSSFFFFLLLLFCVCVFVFVHPLLRMVVMTRVSFTDGR